MAKKINYQNSFSEALGACLLAFLFFMLLLCGVSFLLKLPITSITTTLSLILAFLISYIFFARGKFFIFVLLTTLFSIIGSAWICSLIYDSAYDSYGYHNNIIVMITKGWNPAYAIPWDNSLWSRHYGKGLEMMQAVILAFTGNLQSTKCVNFLFLIATASLSWFIMGKVFPNVSSKWKNIIVIMIVANPVVISQLTTSYNDYALWLETVIVACSLLLIWNESKSVAPYILLCMVLVIGINTKFTHFYYLGIECLFFAIWCICKKKYFILLPGVASVVSAILIGTLIVGFNPYVLNTVGHGNPFYPLIGGNVDIMSENTPSIYEGGNRFINLVKSLLSIGDSEWGYFTGKFTGEDVLRTYSTDARINGFGIVMAPLLILGLIMMVINKASRRWWIVYLFFLFLAFSFDQAWWARYVPFLWALVIIPVLNYAAEGSGDRRLWKKTSEFIAYSMFSLVVINAFLGSVVSIMVRYSYTAYLDYIIKNQKEIGIPIKVANINFSFCQIFDERGVKYVKCDSEELIAEPEQLFYIYELANAPIIAELPKDGYPRLYAAPKSFLEKQVNFSKRKYAPAIKNENQ